MPPDKSEATSMQTALATIVAHATRARCFVILTERTASPVEIAHELDKDVGHVGYHVRKLLQLNLIELVSERPVRGAVEHFYRAVEPPPITDEELAALTIEEREALTRQALRLHVSDLARAVDEHTFDARANRVLARTTTMVDEAGFQELSELHKEMLERAREIQARSAERLRESGGEEVPIVSTTMLFEAPSRGGGATDRS